MTMLETIPSAFPFRPFSPGATPCGCAAAGAVTSPNAGSSRHSSVCLNGGAVDLVRTPVVELLPELQVQERLGRGDAVEPADPVRDVEQVAAVAADDLDEDVELARGDDDVVGLVPAGDLVRHRIGR